MLPIEGVLERAEDNYFGLLENGYVDRIQVSSVGA
jgi:hypothetical protein